MKYDFNEVVNRENTNCLQYDMREKYFGAEDVIPMWVADMDFKILPVIYKAIKERLDHGIFGYTFRSDSFYNAIIKLYFYVK